MSPQWEKRRKRVFEIIEVGTKYDYPSRAYDLFNCILYSFKPDNQHHVYLS